MPGSGEITELTAMEKEFIRKAADVIFPKDGPIPFSGNETGVPEYLENLFRNMANEDVQKAVGWQPNTDPFGLK